MIGMGEVVTHEGSERVQDGFRTGSENVQGSEYGSRFRAGAESVQDEMFSEPHEPSLNF
jgi:hypothetical protein